MAYFHINPISAIVTFFVMLFVLMALLIHRNCCKKKQKPVSLTVTSNNPVFMTTESAASVSDNRRSQHQTRSPEDVYIIQTSERNNDGTRSIDELPPPSYESLIARTCLENQQQDQFLLPPCYDSI